MTCSDRYLSTASLFKEIRSCAICFTIKIALKEHLVSLKLMIWHNRFNSGAKRFKSPKMISLVFNCLWFKLAGACWPTRSINILSTTAVS
ncbi:hypothetical protein OGAPHI_005913 [Ogataea philodendri]|uniref:Uncharacterized protein n=1 Tax=Ogataea philodendri TaxID=1378263 RepID=A0A9P8NYA6_9ASCO|nr:uncharacterized protein OGAPHI_005913 [Ogataea philodendri]KAH3661735.1 hypothetical protein OGAPHI_005913 [Ogataea philodendri]